MKKSPQTQIMFLYICPIEFYLIIKIVFEEVN
jgi:hypothetical protein